MYCRLLFIVLFVFSSAGLAEPAFNRAGFAQYFEAVTGLQTDLTDYSDQLDQLELEQEEMLSTDSEAWAAKVNALPFAHKITESLRGHGFDSIESFTAFSVRIYTALMAVSYEQAPAQFQAAMNMGAAQLEQLRAQGVDEATLAQMKSSMAQSQHMLTAMESAAGAASEADKRAVRDNLDWLQGQFDRLDRAQGDTE